MWRTSSGTVRRRRLSRSFGKDLGRRRNNGGWGGKLKHAFINGLLAAIGKLPACMKGKGIVDYIEAVTAELQKNGIEVVVGL
jgi:hypothetical protein